MRSNKQALLAEVAARTGWSSNPKVLTLGFARRAATYKRATLLFTDPERLAEIAAKAGGLQILYAGKAHPQDDPGKALIQQVVEDAAKLSSDRLRIVYLENYDWSLGALLTAGVDVWVNTPRRPYEASGTSGMKAALNGVPSLSILDGWWIEGCIEGFTGWAIEDGARRCRRSQLALPEAGNRRGSALSAMRRRSGPASCAPRSPSTAPTSTPTAWSGSTPATPTIRSS